MSSVPRKFIIKRAFPDRQHRSANTAKPFREFVKAQADTGYFRRMFSEHAPFLSSAQTGYDRKCGTIPAKAHRRPAAAVWQRQKYWECKAEINALQ
jgi:hypothetical protein